MTALHFFLFTLFTVSVHAHNITEILNQFPEYSVFNSYLSQTKLADEINSRETITVLALPNGAMSAVVDKHPLSVIKNVLSLHVLLDYFDGTKLHKISDGTTTSTTLYQTTGNAHGNVGSVNITDLKGGKVGFGSAIPNSPLASTYTKSVKQIQYNISVLEVSAPIIAPGILTAPAPSGDFNITGALEKAGCKTFASLLVKSGVLKTYQTAIEKGLTIFAPNDEAFKGAKVPDLSELSSADVVSLLQYHAIPSYTPIGTLKTKKDPISTLATNGASKYDLKASTEGDQVTLDTGVDSSRIASTVIDSTPFCIFTVDSVLLPEELYGKSPSPAPGPAPETSPTPAPTPAPEASSPTPMMSPPAPPTSSPAGSPADSPTADSENSTAKKKNAGNVNTPALLKSLLTVSVSVIVSVYLS
ncbi:fasciclin-like arabinogalactan protein 10 [Solanum tuberosum]|uniref:Fasciclin-like arabinogalactan protein 13 n=1 Tax=Solanum tuberosum TaxID=4113 RepID=M1AYQ6_SOLTU|nr:PREDICTED: fasciclin-like arabinogalactan protein 10 [Solanum tuberosum]